jgi:hypothetical protein
MAHWVVIISLAVLTVLVLGGGYMVFFWSGAGTRKLGAPKRDMRTTWKVVKLGEPVLEGMGLPTKIQYGVIISSDEMLAQTQTLLFCPLISGIDDKTSTPIAVLPWHVQVEIRQEADKQVAELDYGRKYVSTKLVLPIGSNEIDMDGLERGYLDEHSRILVSKKLAVWLPPFARIARY